MPDNVTAIQEYRNRDVAEWDTPPNLALIQRTIAPDLTPDEFALFIETARFRGLNPMARQIHAIIHNKKDPSKRRLTIITGIDGFRTIANRKGKFAGMDRPQFELTPNGNIDVCILTGYKMVEGQRCAFTVEAYWDEYAVTGYGGEMWTKMPRTMLAKVAEAKLLRMMLPEELSGLYTSDEMDQARENVQSLAPPKIETVNPSTGEIGPPPENPPPSSHSPSAGEPRYASQLIKDTSVACRAWMFSTIRDKFHMEHEAVLKLLGIESFSKDRGERTVGQVLDEIAAKMEQREVIA